jgi:hypothetical protein
MERDTTILEVGTGDSPNPWSDDDDDLPMHQECLNANAGLTTFHCLRFLEIHAAVWFVCVLYINKQSQ